MAPLNGKLTEAELRARVAELESLNARLMESNRLYETIFTARGTVRLYARDIENRVKRARTALSEQPRHAHEAGEE